MENQKKIVIRFLYWGIVWSFALLIHGCGSAEERKASYVSMAKAFLQEENFPKARVALRNALKIDPKDPHVYFLAGQVSEKEANWPKAFSQYSRAVELDSTHRQAMGRLARFYLAVQEIKGLQGLSDTALSRDPEDDLGHILQACVWLLDGKKFKALVEADFRLKQNPTDPDILLILAVIFSANQELEKAQAVLQRGLTAYPKHVDLMNYLATISIGMKAFDEAEAIYLELLAIEPSVFKHRDTLAGLYRHLRKPGKAMALLREGVALESDNEQRWKSLVMFAESSQREGLIFEALQALPYSLTLRFLLGDHYEQVQDYEKAREVYEAIVTEEEAGGTDLKAEAALDKLNIVEQNPELAQSRLVHVPKENQPQFKALLLKSQLSLFEKEGRSAVEAFRIVLKDEPHNSATQSLLGQAYLLAGEFELAKERMDKAVMGNLSQIDAYSALARLSARSGQLRKAQEYVEARLQVVPSDMATLWTLFQLQLAQQYWTQGNHTITRLREAGGSAYQIELANGLLSAGRQQWDQAVQAFSRAQQANPKALPPLAAIVNVYIQQKQLEEARAYLKKIVNSDSDHPFASGLLAAVLVQLEDTSAAILAFQKQTQVNPTWVESWTGLASLKWSQGKKTEGLDILKTALTHNPDSQVLLNVLASYYQAVGQDDLAIGHYETILHHNPAELGAANNLAYLLADKKGDSESLAKALFLAKKFEAKTQNPFLLDTLAWVYYKMGLNKEAIRLLKNALVRAPDHPLINYHFGLITLKAGDRATAHKHLTKAVQEPSDLENIEEVHQLLAEIQL